MTARRTRLYGAGLPLFFDTDMDAKVWRMWRERVFDTADIARACGITEGDAANRLARIRDASHQEAAA